MRLGFNGATNMKCADLPKDVEIARVAGYDVLEIWGARLREYLDSHSLTELKSLWGTGGLQPYSINSVEFITFKKGAEWEKIMDACHDYCRIAGAIDCQNVVVVPSPRPAGVSDEEIARESVRVLKELSEIADRYGVRLAFEFLGFDWCSVTTLRQCNEIVVAVARDNVGMVLDTFHLFVGGSELDSIDGIDPQKLFIFHINDAEDMPRRQLQDANRLFPGDGVIPLQETVQRLKRIGFDGVASVELFRPEYWRWDPLELAQTARDKTLKAIEA